MTEDIVKRLREYGTSNHVLDEAADRIEQLEAERAELLALVIRYRKETPLGHQPHMIAHLADEAIARATA